MRLFGPLELNKNELRNPVFQNLGANPGTPVLGQFFMSTIDNTPYYWNGTAWLSFGAVSDGSITLAKLAADSVDSSKIVDGSIVAGDIADGTLTLAKLAPNSVDSSKIVDGSIVLADLAANSVDSSKIVDGSIATADIANLAVTAGKIANATITSAQIAAAAGITKSQLAALALVDADIAAGAAIAKSKLAALNIVNADVSAAAAISYSKLALGASIVNADVAAAAAIARSKLDFGTGLVNADLAAGAAIALSKLATDPLARGNHTGTQTVATLSDFAASVRAVRLDEFAAPTAAVAFGGQRATNAADPTAGSDLATKNYVDAARAGLSIKDPARVASTANINLAAPGANIDGVAMVAGDRFLAKDQTTASQNGIYVWNGAAVAATRATDADVSAEVASGTAVWVNEGTVNQNARWVLTTNNPINLGVTALVFTQDFKATPTTAGAGLTTTGGALNVIAANGTITVNADSIQVGVLVAGNIPAGLITSAMILDGTIVDADIAAGAAIAVTKISGAVRKYAVTIGDAAATVFVVNHALNTQDVQVFVRDAAAPFEVVYPVVECTDNNNVTVRFTGIVPALNSFRVIVQG